VWWAYVNACAVYTHTLYGAGRGEWGDAQYIHIFLRSTYAAPHLATRRATAQ